MRAVVCVPRRGQTPEYDHAWALASVYYRRLNVFVADSPTPRFQLNTARNAAAKAAGDWDVAAFINADCLIPVESIQRGIAHAVATGHVTVPWDHYWSLTHAGHEAGLDSQVPIGNPDLEARWIAASEPFRQPFYAPGGDIIIPRSEWDRIGGWDESFTGYEPEDAAMLVAAGQFDRLTGPAFHFWHPSNVGEEPGAWPPYRARWHEMQSRGEFVQRLPDEGRELYDFGGWQWG